MTPLEFAGLFEELCEWYHRTPNDLVTETYFEQLRSRTPEQWTAAIKATYATCSYMPTPAAILSLVMPSGDEKALEQWTLIHALACDGDVDTRGLDDEAIVALEKLTGKTPAAAIRALGQFDSFQTAKWESQFKRLYALAVQRAPLDSLPPAPTQSMLQGAK
jgi:hypothetical protein